MADSLYKRLDIVSVILQADNVVCTFICCWCMLSHVYLQIRPTQILRAMVTGRPVSHFFVSELRHVPARK